MDSRVKTLHKKFSRDISYADLERMYYYSVYRHELFHYQVERFCTKLELVTDKRIYAHCTQIYQRSHNTYGWLEEALAEAAVLKSRLVSTRTGVKPAILTKIYSYDLKDMPPGYQDHACTKFGGVESAHKLFVSQILENTLTPQNKTPKLVTIKDEFQALDRNVPTYLVTGFTKVNRKMM